MLILSRSKMIIVILSTLLLLLIPTIIWILNWQWSASMNYYIGLDEFLFFITQTGTAMTYAFITCVVLASWLSWCVKGSQSWVLVFLTAFILLIGSQAIKTIMKSFYQEPRPYTAYLVEKGVDFDQFYQEKRSVRKIVVKDAFKENDNAPKWLKKHWQKETGYSFPSGHAAFAVCWMMIFLLFLPMNRQRDWWIFSIIWIWTALMIISRVRFGMHYPIDVATSIIYVPIMCVIYARLTECPKITACLDGLCTIPNKLFSLINRR